LWVRAPRTRIDSIADTALLRKANRAL
jgi:hypothetical protein